jgi:hypothetical protein
VLTARGDAKLENRQWIDARRHDLPRVFHVAGQHVSFDNRTSTAHVVGDGLLLIRDTAPDKDRADVEGAPFSARGITRFRWTEELEFSPDPYLEHRASVIAIGDVIVEHKSLDDEVSALSCMRLDATLQRDEPEMQAEERPDTPMNLGGGWDLQRVVGEGGVHIVTPTRDVRCDAFDYNLLTRFAEISARPGRLTSVLSRPTGHSFQAERAQWNMAEDTIIILRGQAAGGR